MAQTTDTHTNHARQSGTEPGSNGDSALALSHLYSLASLPWTAETRKALIESIAEYHGQTTHDGLPPAKRKAKPLTGQAHRDAEGVFTHLKHFASLDWNPATKGALRDAVDLFHGNTHSHFPKPK